MTSAVQVTVANGHGLWGDTGAGPAQLVERAQLDYLTLDYLAEVIMSTQGWRAGGRRAPTTRPRPVSGRRKGPR